MTHPTPTSPLKRGGGRTINNKGGDFVHAMNFGTFIFSGNIDK